jgi:hypothetical protein
MRKAFASAAPIRAATALRLGGRMRKVGRSIPAGLFLLSWEGIVEPHLIVRKAMLKSLLGHTGPILLTPLTPQQKQIYDPNMLTIHI